MYRRTIPVILSTLLLSFSSALFIGCGSSSTPATPNEQPVNNPVPTISTLSAASVILGSDDLSLTVTGTNFTPTTKISFGTDVLTPSTVGATTLAFVVPKALLTTAKIVPVTASNPTPGGGTSNAVNFTIAYPVPTLASFVASSIYLNTTSFTLEIDGHGFTAATRLSFGTDELTPASVTESHIAVPVPDALLTVARIVPVTASNPTPGGGASNEVNFTIGYPLPTLGSFVASSTLLNSTGFTLEVDGHGFTAATRIYFGTDALTPASVTESHIVAPVPDALLTTARLVSITASNPEPLGGTSNSIEFSVNNPTPVITALSVDTAEVGLETDLALEITGTNFVSGAVVEFGPNKLTPGTAENGKLGVTVPANAFGAAAEIPVTVTNPGPGGGPSNAMTFKLNNPLPVLTALSQQEATAGSSAFELLLIGSKFVSTTTVDFGGTVLTPSSATKGELVVSIPETAFANGGVIQVKAVSPGPGGGSSSTLDFTINNPVPVITSVSPVSITNTGSDVVISLIGSNFVASSAAQVGTNPITSSFGSKTAMQVTVPKDLVAAGVPSGKISISVSNPNPAGGSSNAVDVIVHDKAALAWQTLANGVSTLPGTTTAFGVFGSPSINASGMAVFRGQSVLSTSEGSGESSTTTGIYTADLANNGKLAKVVDIATIVPDPNTLKYGNTYAKFGGFPSFPNIDQASSFVGFNATHPPVISLPSNGKAGSAGIYSNPAGALDTGVGLFVADATTTYPYFQNPELPGTAFGAFPNSPAVVNGNTLVFKGDFLNGTAVAMGVYSRDVVAAEGTSPVALIASTYSTKVPGKTMKFGYLAAPSAVGSTVVFVGYDRKDAPTAGGIYSTPISAPTFTTLVAIGTPVPGEDTTVTFNRFGDAVSFDGRFVGFWGAWGTETTNVHVTCPTDDAAVQAYCLTIFPNGYDATVPVHQGMFVYDTANSTLAVVAKTGSEFSDFTYWPFVGTLPEEGAPTTTGGSSGGGDEPVEVPLEPPAFVLSPAIAVVGQSGGNYQAAFKAKSGPVDGIYMRSGPGDAIPIVTALDSTMAGAAVDNAASASAQIQKFDLERSGMNGNWLAIGVNVQDGGKQSTSTGLYAADLSAQ